MPRVDITKANVGIFTFSAATQFPIVNFEFDLTNFRDPLGNLKLKTECEDGRDLRVRDWIREDPRYIPIRDEVTNICHDLVKGGEKKWLSIAFRDFHGVWKSRAVGELIAEYLADLDFMVGVKHNGI